MSDLKRPYMRASGPPLIVGFLALMCAAASVGFAFGPREQAVQPLVNLGFTLGPFVLGLPLFLFATYPGKSRVIRGKKLTWFYGLLGGGLAVAFIGLFLSTVSESWIPLAVIAVLLAVLAVLSIRLFMEGNDRRG